MSMWKGWDFCGVFFFFLHRFSSLLAYFLHFLSPNHSICASSTGMAMGKPGKSFLVSSNIPNNILGVAHGDTEGFKDKTLIKHR